MSEILSHYAELITDPAHTLVELTFVLLVDVLFLGIAVPLVKRWITREHAAIDAEHGHEHDEPEPLPPTSRPTRDSRMS